LDDFNNKVIIMAVDTIVQAGKNVVSFPESYLHENPRKTLNKDMMDAAVKHVEKAAVRARTFAAVALVLSILALAGILGAGHIIFGALLAIAVVGGLYCYFCREAAGSLRDRQAQWIELQRAKSDETTV
jgi:hypothetical protein